MRYVVHIRANTYIHDSWKDIFLEITTVILFPKIEPTLFENQRFDLNLKYIFWIRKLAYSLLIFHSFKKKCMDILYSKMRFSSDINLTFLKSEAKHIFMLHGETFFRNNKTMTIFLFPKNRNRYTISKTNQS